MITDTYPMQIGYSPKEISVHADDLFTDIKKTKDEERPQSLAVFVEGRICPHMSAYQNPLSSALSSPTIRGSLASRDNESPSEW